MNQLAKYTSIIEPIGMDSPPMKSMVVWLWGIAVGCTRCTPMGRVAWLWEVIW